MDNSLHNWLDSMNSQVEFYINSFSKKRKDSDFDWVWQYSREGFRVKARRFLMPCDNLFSLIRGRSVSFTRKWLNEKSDLLWDSRQLLEDELSRHLFDCHLLLNICDHTRYYYPRVDYDDFITIINETEYNGDMPKDYCGLPLKLYRIKMNNTHFIDEIEILTTKLQIDLLNKYRQYFIKRSNLDFSPSAGEVVFDCGACLGDISTIFAALVGNSGEVHLFDPVPLHAQICQCHADLNPTLRNIFNIQTLAVGNTSTMASGAVQNAMSISPGGCAVDNFESISLDDYVMRNDVRKVDYIKMDIEGSEIVALQGSAMILHKFKPRLAICTYHKPSDIWEIPKLIKKLNPEYKIYFGHHSPKQYESVYYAI